MYELSEEIERMIHRMKYYGETVTLEDLERWAERVSSMESQAIESAEYADEAE